MLKLNIQFFADEFPLNYKNKYEICTTPDEPEETATWAPIAAGISTVDPSFDDETDDTALTI